MILTGYARRMARYNTWMNDRLYEACAALPDAARKEDVGAFFKSIHGTLNHLLVADRVWLGRFTGPIFVPVSLAQELHADFGDLRAARAAMDASIEAWAASLTDDALAGDLVYTSIVNPQPRTCPLWIAVTHFFNHQTHHRGQITTLLMQRGVDPGVTDLIWLPAPKSGTDHDYRVPTIVVCPGFWNAIGFSGVECICRDMHAFESPTSLST